MFAKETILLETDTGLDHYAVVELTYEGRPARVLFSGANRAAQSGVALDDGSDLLFDYNQRFLELVSGLYPRRLLLIGGGAYTLPMALCAALPELTVDVVEIDPALDKIAADYFGFKPSKRLRVIHQAGRRYLDGTSQIYDIILVDAFAHLSIPRQLASAEAAAAVYRRLAPNGVAAINLISAYQGRTATTLRRLVAAYQNKFQRLDIFPAAHGLTSWLPQNMLLVAQKDKPRDLAPLMRYAPFEVPEIPPAEALHDKTT